MRYEWDFKDAKTNIDVFVNQDGVNTNMMDLIKGGTTTRLPSNTLNPGTYKICLTASVGKNKLPLPMKGYNIIL